MTTRQASTAVLAQHITENELLGNVVQLAKLLHYRVHHCRPGRTADGEWRTAIQGHAGFLDLVLAHPSGRLVFAELKSQRGQVSPGQVVWRSVLDTVAAANPLVRVVLWRPEDWLSGHIHAVLAGTAAEVAG